MHSHTRVCLHARMHTRTHAHMHPCVFAYGGFYSAYLRGITEAINMRREAETVWGKGEREETQVSLWWHMFGQTGDPFMCLLGGTKQNSRYTHTCSNTHTHTHTVALRRSTTRADAVRARVLSNPGRSANPHRVV